MMQKIKICIAVLLSCILLFGCSQPLTGEERMSALLDELNWETGDVLQYLDERGELDNGTLEEFGYISLEALQNDPEARFFSSAVAKADNGGMGAVMLRRYSV